MEFSLLYIYNKSTLTMTYLQAGDLKYIRVPFEVAKEIPTVFVVDVVVVI